MVIQKYVHRHGSRSVASHGFGAIHFRNGLSWKWRPIVEFRPVDISTLLLVAARVILWPTQATAISKHCLVGRWTTLPGHPASRWKTFMRNVYSQPLEFIRESVRHSFISSYVPSTHSKWLLNVCSEIEDLYIFAPTPEDLLSVIGSLHLKRLHCGLGRLYGYERQSNFTHPLFAHITHLEILDKITQTDIWLGLSAIPYLTHLAFNNVDSAPFLLKFFHGCPSLRALIVLNLQVDADMSQLAEDPRFVVMECLEYAVDWQMGAHTGRGHIPKSTSSRGRADDFICVTMQY
ncbi:hypothetical protein C8R43DRAFT_1229293 [Mycena crocata]|nr:hypothetical protein C8R43DRAFT_1229293 [Mycena crocata]